MLRAGKGEDTAPTGEAIEKDGILEGMGKFPLRLEGRIIIM